MAYYAIAGTLEFPEDTVDLKDILLAIGEAIRNLDDDIELELDQIDEIC